MPEFTTEELELIKALGIPLPKPTVYKILKVNQVCQLCKTVVTQYFKMVQQDKTSWVKDSVIKPTEVDIPKTVETYNTSLSTCKLCRTVLMKKEKIELIEILIYNANSFPVSKHGTLPKYEWKKKIRKGEEDE